MYQGWISTGDTMENKLDTALTFTGVQMNACVLRRCFSKGTWSNLEGGWRQEQELAVWMERREPGSSGSSNTLCKGPELRQSLGPVCLVYRIWYERAKQGSNHAICASRTEEFGLYLEHSVKSLTSFKHNKKGVIRSALIEKFLNLSTKEWIRGNQRFTKSRLE